MPDMFSVLRNDPYAAQTECDEIVCLNKKRWGMEELKVEFHRLEYVPCIDFGEGYLSCFCHPTNASNKP